MWVLKEFLAQNCPERLRIFDKLVHLSSTNFILKKFKWLKQTYEWVRIGNWKALKSACFPKSIWIFSCLLRINYVLTDYCFYVRRGKNREIFNFTKNCEIFSRIFLLLLHALPLPVWEDTVSKVITPKLILPGTASISIQNETQEIATIIMEGK